MDLIKYELEIKKVEIYKKVVEAKNEEELQNKIQKIIMEETPSKTMELDYIDYDVDFKKQQEESEKE